jgi:AhpD family alkylhydroperoxidase
MSEHVKEFYEEFKKGVGKMQKETPKTLSAFVNLFKETMGEGALTVAEKEAIAVGIAVAIQCKPCLYLHVQKAAQAGLSRAQILEAAGVAVMMAGGPGYTHVPEVINACDAVGVQ